MRFIFYPLLFMLLIPLSSFGHIGPGNSSSGKPNSTPNRPSNQVQYRMDCAEGISQVDLAVNNVRARLLIGGDLWWDGETNGRYVVPKIDPASGQQEVSSLFAGGVWIGGFDPSGNLKVAAQTYGQGSNRDFWPGPLTDQGLTDGEVCDNWDQFFKVVGTDIDRHLANYREAKENGVPYDPDDIPESILKWPARGNDYFLELMGFQLPASQNLAPFFAPDSSSSEFKYEPELGDYPVIQIRGCDMPQYPDEMIFWVYNDAGNIHSESNGEAIRMEVQAQAFGYNRNDELNDMTFVRYKLINRAVEDITQTFFAMWVDPDLGCYTDDYVGCDTSRSLAFVYNADALDGESSASDCNGVATYGTEIPLIGVDYFRGPLDENAIEIGMSSFTYYNNRLLNPPPGTDDPTLAPEFYNYLSGRWRDGTPFTSGGSGYDLTSANLIDYAFTDLPNDANGWSMCSANLADGDRRTIQASGPFTLKPGAQNELIIGVPWVPDIEYPCPDIRPLLRADDIAQGLFDNCFKLTRGPDAPDLDWVELDKKIIAVLSNDRVWNNYQEAYSVVDFQAPLFLSEEERSYKFEGYKLFQLVGPNVSRSELKNPDKARLIYQVDVDNEVSEIFNWFAVENPNALPGGAEEIWVPESKVQGADQGIEHTFEITEDQFSEGDRRLINHKKYYYTVIAYGYNNYKDFIQNGLVLDGQPTPYIESDRNIRNYTVIPRPIVDQTLHADYGDGVIITRLDGEGAGGNFLAISDETRTEILEGNSDGTITYLPGAGPINVKIYNPLEVVDGNYELSFVDEDMSNDRLDQEVRWTLKKSDVNETIVSDMTIEKLNEQVIPEYGFSLSIAQTEEPGDQKDATNGGIGMDVQYKDVFQDPWLAAVTDTDPGEDGEFNYIRTGQGEINFGLDPTQALSALGNQFFVPYTLCAYQNSNTTQPYITPAYIDNTFSNVAQVQNPLSKLNNVDVVLTPDKSKWSRCAIIETANVFYTDNSQGLGIPSEGGAGQFDLRAAPSVGKDDADGDGRPDPDGDGTGMGWFPGYAIDVETGERLNIFFGENSTYDGSVVSQAFNDEPNGRDMMWNPTSQFSLETGVQTIYNNYVGGQHFIYVSRQPYDECAQIRQFLSGTGNQKRIALKDISWTSLFYLQPGQKMLSYSDGLIPNEALIQCRVQNKYGVKTGTGDNNGHPKYLFSIEGQAPQPLTTTVEINSSLNTINVVPNPYYGFSDYETSQFSNIVKITNLPAQCVVTIYTLDGKHIRTYNRNEAALANLGRSNPGVPTSQYNPDIEWDLKNSKGIPVASGVYLIHVDADGLGERVIKWFGVSRQFDPSGL